MIFEAFLTWGVLKWCKILDFGVFFQKMFKKSRKKIKKSKIYYFSTVTFFMKFMNIKQFFQPFSHKKVIFEKLFVILRQFWADLVDFTVRRIQDFRFFPKTSNFEQPQLFRP